MLRDELARTYDRIKELEARIDRLEHQENDYLKEIERLRREKLDITERYGRFVREYSEAGVRLRVLRDRILQLEMVMKANELAVPPPRREEDQEYLAPASHPETPARGD